MGAHVGDIGTIIRYTTTTDLSGNSALKLKYKKPDGTTGEWTATVYSTYSAQYGTTEATDLDQAGSWKLQVYVEMVSWKGHSEEKTFEVLPATEPLLMVWPDSGVVGETFYIGGSGFQPNENITLTFTGPTTATLNVTADEEGNLFYIEWDSTGYLWGTYTLDAVGDQGSTASATFEILPAARIYLPLVTKNYQ